MMIILRALLIAHIMLSPFVWVYLQQSLFRESFDDNNGNTLIMRLYMISAIACVLIFVISFSPEGIAGAFMEGLKTCS